MLFVSSLAAVMVPVEPTPETTSTQAPPRTRSEPAGELVRRSVDSSADPPPTVKVEAGDQLQLRVTSPRVATLVINGLGAQEDVGPGAPAFFDVLLREPGTYEVLDLSSRRRRATIEVAPAS